MTATDELCRLLDNLEVSYERNGTKVMIKRIGIEGLREILYERGVEYHESIDGKTWWSNGEQTFCAVNRGRHLSVDGLTPAQAVDATLGRGTCRVDVLNTGDCAGYECSEYIMHCNGCGHEFGHVLYNEDGDVWMSEPPHFCPNCGRKVVEK